VPHKVNVPLSSLKDSSVSLAETTDVYMQEQGWESKLERRRNRGYIGWWGEKGISCSQSLLLATYPVKASRVVIAVDAQLLDKFCVVFQKHREGLTEESFVQYRVNSDNQVDDGTPSPYDDLCYLPIDELKFRAVINERFPDALIFRDAALTSVYPINVYFNTPTFTGQPLEGVTYGLSSSIDRALARLEYESGLYPPDLTMPREAALLVGDRDRSFPHLRPIEVESREEAKAIIDILQPILEQLAT
jgi:hypothetical protein